MRLWYDAPEGWSSERIPGGVLVQNGAFGTRISGVIVPKGTDPRTLLEADRPADTRVEYLQVVEDLESQDGWPMKLVTLEVRDGADRRVQVRIGAVYELTHYLGVAVARLAGDDDRAAVLDILMRVQPNLWPDEAVCIAELWWKDAP